MDTARVISFQSPGSPEPTAIAPERRISGDPQTTVDNRYSSADARFHAGIWTSTIGSWRVSYTEDEYCLLIRGEIRLIGDDGSTQTYAAGDAFVIPAGFSGVWETLEDCAKHYVIYERG
jgi:uncharacterized cupin superfamily protein